MHGCRRGSGLQGWGCHQLLLRSRRLSSSDSSQTAVLLQMMRLCGGGSSKMSSAGAEGSDSLLDNTRMQMYPHAHQCTFMPSALLLCSLAFDIPLTYFGQL